MKTVKEQLMVDELDEPPYEVPSPATPSPPQHATPFPARDSPFSGEDSSSSDSSVQRGPIKMRSLREVYEQIEEDGAINLFCLYVDHEPLTFQGAKEEHCWRSAVKEEMHANQKNDPWELITLPQNHKIIGVKWVYKIKHTTDSEVNQYKARLVLKGYKQKYDIDNEEVFTPVTRLDT